MNFPNQNKVQKYDKNQFQFESMLLSNSNKSHRKAVVITVNRIRGKFIGFRLSFTQFTFNCIKCTRAVHVIESAHQIILTEMLLANQFARLNAVRQSKGSNARARFIHNNACNPIFSILSLTLFFIYISMRSFFTSQNSFPIEQTFLREEKTSQKTWANAKRKPVQLS